MAFSDAEILTILFNNFNPAVEASTEFYVDCSDVRGGTTFIRNLCVELSEAQTDSPSRGNYTHALFTGHIGGGKSSELKHLQDEMTFEEVATGRKRLFPVFIDMQQFLDDYDAAREEILLAIVSELATVFERELGIKLEDSYLTKRFGELGEYFLSDAEINEGTIAIPGFSTKIQRMKTSPEMRKKVRAALRGHTSNLLGEINNVFIEARTKLKKTKKNGGAYSDFVLIVDGLDRLHGYDDHKGSDAAQHALFVEDSPILTGLQAHCVFTMALAAVRAYDYELWQRYNRKPFLLPMIKTEKRGELSPSGTVTHPEFSKGRERLRQIIEKRLPAGISLGQVFEPEALDFLVEYCGGHVRSLLIFARASTLHGERKLPITYHAAQRAISENNTFSSPEGGTDDWTRLAELEVSDNQEWPTHKVEYRRLLENLYVLEYINGGDEDPFNENIPWYCVHPIVRQRKPFKRALMALQAES